MRRLVCSFVLVLSLLWTVTIQAADTHQGKVVNTNPGKLTMTDVEGKNQHTMDVASTAMVVRDGKTVALADLKPGDTITVTTDKVGNATTVTKVEATPAGH